MGNLHTFSVSRSTAFKLYYENTVTFVRITKIVLFTYFATKVIISNLQKIFSHDVKNNTFIT